MLGKGCVIGFTVDLGDKIILTLSLISDVLQAILKYLTKWDTKNIEAISMKKIMSFGYMLLMKIKNSSCKSKMRTNT